ncbi:hypothetical protein GTY54_30250 [Streptomyces sp. SID625]|nr:hypothetical protein [Streptomyces sp. SID625]
MRASLLGSQVWPSTENRQGESPRLPAAFWLRWKELCCASAPEALAA